MATILFVDDEPNVLSGIRRMMRHHHTEWETLFVNSAVEALSILENQFIDVIVSDLRMPEMDGVELLQHVRERSPETVRMALSGHADREATLRAATQIHQFLYKPCDAETLAKTLSRALSLGKLINSPKLRRVVSSMDFLPSIPSLHDEVIRLLDSPASGLKDVGAAIAQDPGMSIKVLQLVNSAFYGLRHPVSDPAQAAVLLGIDALKILVLSIKIFEQFNGKPLHGISLEGIWEHSVSAAMLAKHIAQSENTDEYTCEEAFLAGLLHDVGKLVFAANAHNAYQGFVAAGPRSPEAMMHLEREHIGGSHGEVGGYLLGLWGFSENIILSVAYHHCPNEHNNDTFEPLTAVHIANTSLHRYEEELQGLPAHYHFDMDYLGRLVSEERVYEWERQCRILMKSEETK